MATAEQEHQRPRQGLTAAEKERAILAGADLTRRTSIVREHNFSAEDRANLATMVAGDPVSDYAGFPELQAEQYAKINADRAATEAFKASVELSRIHLPSGIILGREAAPDSPWRY